MTKIVDNVIATFEGIEKVAEICGINPSQVYRWRYARDKGGCGGIIPSKHHQCLLEAARLRELDLQPADLVVAREVAA